jgi:hypothetical protein
VPLNSDVSFNFENQIYNEQENFHTAIKPYNNSEIKNYWKIKSQFKKENSKKLLHFGDTSKYLIISPIINTFISSNYNNSFNYNLGIGLTINTQIFENLSLNVNFAQNKSQYPNFLNLYDRYTPHFGQYIKNQSRVDYFYMRGYLSYSPSKYFNFQFGKDKNFWGDGYRSLLLSDNSDAYWFLKGSVRIWKIKYTILFSGLQDIDSEYNNLGNPSINNFLQDKYSTSHFLSWNVGKRVNFNLFETVIWRGEDSTGYRGFDVNYLNPIVFYRPVEFSLGSPDNVILGGGYRLKVGRTNHFYGQFVLDEFKLKEIKNQNGWWANKYGFQFGFKSYNLFNIKNLFWLIEYNRVRPFTYSHGNSTENWGNMYQAMAHPLGANFTEQISILKYPYKRFIFKFKMIFSQHGINSFFYNDYIPFGDYTQQPNYGGDIYVSYNDRINEYGNTQNQGDLQKLSIIDLSASYLLVSDWNLYFNFGVNNRNFNSNNNLFIYFSFKTNLYNNEIDY